MTIQIANRLHPFSHRPGTACVVPGTSIQVTAFPTRLRFMDLSTHQTWEEKTDLKGPVEGFTVELDLERGCVVLFGQTAEGFRRLWVCRAENGIQVTPQKPPITVDKIERLSLGKHTKLDWELIGRRANVEEIAPVLFVLGQQVPSVHGASPILELLKFSTKQMIYKQLQTFFKAGFHGILAPRLHDDDFQGLVEEGPTEGSPLILLRQGYEAIRDLLFKQSGNEWQLLPFLPPEFHAGRLVNLKTKEGDEVSLEWSKKELKCVTIRAAVSREVFLLTQKGFHSFRVNKKISHEVKNSLPLEAGKRVVLDRFQK